MNPLARFTRRAVAVSILCAGTAASADGPASAATPGPTQAPAVLKIGAQHWSAEHFARLRAAGGPPDELSPEQLASFVKNFADRYVVARQAEAAGLAADARVAQKLALARDRVLAEEQRAWLQNAAPIDDAVVRADFDARPGRYDELRLSHILVRITDNDQALPPAQRRNAAQALARAKALQRQLQAGANFKALARKYSEDGPSAPAGGELPTIFGKDIKSEVQASVKALQAQQVSAPVLSPEGYHLIRLEERSVTDFEGARRLLALELREAWAERQIEQLRASSPAVFDAAAGQALEEARALSPLVSTARP